MPRLPALACLLVLGAGPTARAGEAVTVELVGTALVGKGRPQVIVRVQQEVAGLSLELSSKDGASVRRKTGRLGRGAVQTFELEHPPGVAQWTGRLVVTPKRGESGEIPLVFETTLLAPPTLTVGPDAVDLDARTVTLAVDREAPTIALKVIGDDGAPLAELQETLAGAKAGAPLTLAWKTSSTARVLRIDVRATDRHGYYQELELYPWRIEIPHEDVLFPTGEAVIAAAEQPKLETALGELRAAVARYGRFARVALFVEGHTDTVGDAGSNRTLSAARAQAIARWFRSRGLTLPISYAGLGEDAPLVPTADAIDEPRNRRAAYIVAVEPPAGPRWRRLP